MRLPDYAYYRGYSKYYCYSNEDEDEILVEDNDTQYAIDDEQFIEYCREEYEEDYPTLRIVREDYNENGYMDGSTILFEGKEADEE